MLVSFSGTDGMMRCQTRPSVLPIMFIMTADSTGGKATKGVEKWAVANTTAKDEFCIPTCNPQRTLFNAFPRCVMFVVLKKHALDSSFIV
jgi:hypothetical protein